MAAAKPHFRLFGIPVRVEVLFFVILAVFGYSYGYESGSRQFHAEYVISFVAIGAISILVHELGHALAFKYFGVHPSITLHGMGGVTSGSGDLSPGKNILITLAGPLPPLLLIGVPAWFVLSSPGNANNVVLEQIFFVNVLWSVFNLVPILPLDGGAVMASVLELLFRGRGRQIANVISIIVAGALALVCVTVLRPSQPFLAAFAVMFAVVNVMELSRRGRGGVAAGGDPLSESHRALLHGQPQMGEYLAHEAVINARDLEKQRWGNELIAWARLFSGDVYGAQQQAAVMPPSRPPSQSFHGALALASGRRDEGVTVLAWALAREPAGPAKSLAAVAVARAGVTGEVAAELRGMGPDGAEAVRLLGQLLEYAGFHEQAVIASGGSSPQDGRHPGQEPPPDPRAVPEVHGHGSSPDQRLRSHDSGGGWSPAPYGGNGSNGGGVDLPPPPSSRPALPPTAPSAWPSQPPSAPPTGPSPWERPDG